MSNHHHPAPTLAPAEVHRDLLRGIQPAGRRFWTAVIILGAFFLAGMAGFAYRAASDGFDDRLPWGYYAASFSFLLTVAGAAPILSIALRLAKGHWRRPFTRIAESFSVVGVLALLMFLPLLALLPPLEGRTTLWIDWREKSPQIYDSLGVAFLVLCGLVFLWIASVPDMAALRLRSSGRLQGLYTRLAGFWHGNKAQWRVHATALGLLGALYFMFYVFVQSMVSIDFSMSLVPGWKDAVFPAFQVMTGFQGALGAVLVTMFIVRWAGGYQRYLTVEQFWGVSKLLLPISLLWAYFWWSTFIVYWYGRSPAERDVLETIMFGPYKALFTLVMILNFGVPLVFLIWNQVRKSILGPTLVGASVLVGNLVDRLRIYVSSFSVENSLGTQLERVPATHYPDAADILIILGTVAGAILLLLLATRVVPIISGWEMKELSLLRKVRPYLHREVVVLGKPE
jgi:molybdopterin-containing oxidoreductase family membrane subunit